MAHVCIINYFSFVEDAVMGTKMNAQVEDSDYVKAVYRYTYLEK